MSLKSSVSYWMRLELGVIRLKSRLSIYSVSMVVMVLKVMRLISIALIYSVSRVVIAL